LSNRFEHIYLHWPFCNKKCSYCDFISLAKHEAFVEKYKEALCNEIEASNSTEPIKTIFLGGGTPSLASATILESIFNRLEKRFCLDHLEEVTIEANPGDVTKNRLIEWKALGINRLSIGVQILNEQILKKVNRHQANVSVDRLLEIAPKHIPNISVDLILGLPGTTTEVWHETLERLISYPTRHACPIKHISIYLLTVYDKTPLFFKLKKGALKLPSEDWIVERYIETVAYLESKNFFQYEISNFSRPGYKSIHNLAYWNHKEYRGFGLSAASFAGNKRLVNSHNLLEYLDYWGNPERSGEPPYQTNELLSKHDLALEALMLGLRQKNGLDLHRMLYFLEGEQEEIIKEKILGLRKKKLIEMRDGRVFLTTLGMLLENKVILNFVNESATQ